MKAKRKLKKEEKLHSFSMYELEGTFVSVIKKLEKIRDDWTDKGYKNIRLEHDIEYDYGDVQDNYIYMYGQRMETQEEADKREKAAAKARESRKKSKKKAAARKLEEEKKTYLRLKKKFEGETS